MNRSELTLWLAGIAAVAVVSLSYVACTIHKQSIIREAMRAGENPILARCALDSVSGDAALAALCATAAYSRIEAK